MYKRQIESYGTFPLPEAQIDRFFMRLSLGYMQREEELAVISRPPTTEILSELEQVVTPDEIEQLKKDARLVAVSPDVAGYLMDIVQKTRTESRFVTGVSTRGAIAFYRACQVWAALQGRDYVVPEDVQRMAEPVLCHRIVSGGSVREGDKPVSYTHLDVYKRQEYRRPGRSCGSRPSGCQRENPTARFHGWQADRR